MPDRITKAPGLVRRGLLCAAVVLSALSSAFAVSQAHASSAVHLRDLTISPDGGLVAVEYCWGAKEHCGTAVVNTATANIRMMPNPPGKQLIWASFTNDSKSLIAASACALICEGYDRFESQVVKVNIETGEMKQITGGHGLREFPVEAPDGKSVLFIEKGILERNGEVFGTTRNYMLTLADVATGAERVLLGEEADFKTGIFRPSFVGQEDVIFSAMKNGPEILGYRLRFGSTPETVIGQAMRSNAGDPGISSVSASAGGRISYVGLSRSAPYKSGEKFNFEVFESENGKVRQLTELKTFIAHAEMSRDGHFVAFLANQQRDLRSVDLSVVEVDSGQVKSIPLLGRLTPNPADN